MTADQNAGLAPANVTITDEELFRHALAPEVPQRPETPAAETPPAPATPPGEQPRDAQGRFAKQPDEQAPQAPAAATQQPPAPEPQPPPADADVPAWRHREIREERDQIKQRNAQLEAMLIEAARREQAAQLAQQQAQAAQKPEPVPDLVANPEAYHAFVQNQFNERMRNLEANFSFRLAHQAHGELFEQAFGEMIQRADRGDPSIAQSVMRSPDPGAAVVNWYARERTIARVGADPEAWFNQQLEERLKDQKFSGQLLERMRGGAQQTQAANGGAPPVQLPPSLNRMAAAAPVDSPGDMSDQSLFDYAFRQGRGRR